MQPDASASGTNYALYWLCHKLHNQHKSTQNLHHIPTYFSAKVAGFVYNGAMVISADEYLSSALKQSSLQCVNDGLRSLSLWVNLV